MIYNNILEAIGNTPLIKLNHIVPEGAADVYVKNEGLDVGGSIKTRTALNMIERADQAKDGRLNLITCYADNVPVQLGTNTPDSNKAAKASLDRACADLKAGTVQALVTAPLCKEALNGGHTEYLEKMKVTYFDKWDKITADSVS